jgi:tetratricopeptide (TPR) repeat protein
MIGSALLMAFLFAQSIVDVFNAANADVQAHRWADAAQKYEQVLKEDPTHVPSMFSLAVCYANLDNPKRAAELYSTLLEQDGSVYEARVNFAWLLEKMGDKAAAEQQMEKAVMLRPDDPNADMIAASFFSARGALDRAYAYLTEAEKKGLQSAQLFIALSQAETQLNHDEAKSREYLEKAFALDPANKDIQHDLGQAYRRAGEHEKAIALLKPLLPETRLDVALSYFANKNYVEAAELFRELSQKEPNNVDYLYLLGESYVDAKRYSDAIPPLARVLSLQPNLVEAYATLGTARYALEDWQGAAAALSKFLEFKPDHAFSQFMLATCFDRLGNDKEALLHYNRFLALDDGSSDVRSFQARQRAKALEARVRK